MGCREQSLFLLQALALRSSAVLCSCARCDSQSPWQVGAALLFVFFTVSLLKNSSLRQVAQFGAFLEPLLTPGINSPTLPLLPCISKPPGSAPRLLQVSPILLFLQSPGSSMTLISHLPCSQVGALPLLLSPRHPRNPSHSWLG